VQHAFNLSVNSAYPAKATIRTLLTKAASQSRNLAINAEIVMPEIIDVLLGKANAQMMSIAKLANAKDANSTSTKLKEKLAAAPK
ncbi:MAG: 50S ribosomal protein L10, partial [Candidatus Methanoperedens sp.]|nr:50S ribosomal protein L10 [Candidatus Methanoperedens sp.]